MEAVIDSSIWVDHFRGRGSKALRRQVHEVVGDAGALLTEPILFELSRACPARQLPFLEAQLSTVPILATSPNLWHEAGRLGQRCVKSGFLPTALDLLIAQICIHHALPLTTFDTGFAHIAKASALEIQLLKRAV